MADIQVLVHSAIRLKGSKTIYFDPFSLNREFHDADVVLVTHSHFDHFSPEDIEKVMKEDTILVAPLTDKDAVTEKLPWGDRLVFLRPFETVTVLSDVKIEAVPAYNPGKKFHPKENEWLGYVVTLDGLRYYVCGDTDIIPEMKDIHADYGFFPCGGTYTMDLEAASDAAAMMDVTYAVPTHFGSVTGDKTDGFRFNELFVTKRLPMLKKRFEEMGVSDSVYEETLTDLDAKREECRKMNGCGGLPDYWKWFGKFLQGSIRRYGRLEYELLTREDVNKRYPGSGDMMGDFRYILNVHIPSNGGPLTSEACLDSLRKAYKAYAEEEKRFESGKLLLMCHSWLLNPEHAEFLPETSNIRRFQSLFKLIDTDEKKVFTDGWRVFGQAAKGPAENLPEETELQRGYKAILLSGRPVYSGLGIMLFDGTETVPIP